MKTGTFGVKTGSRKTVVDITGEAAAFVAGEGDGLLNVFLPHATAGVAIIEMGAGSHADLLDAIDRLLPPDDALYRHRHGSAGHGADHVLPAWIAPSLIVPFVQGELMLGTWQSIVLVDPNRDNATRTVRLTMMSGG
ncbi:MAG: secondary thiamine-phosphate synthase enzyme YjbQ [Acidimicrobiia bacterium]|nr:MAG: secondary thiamine-phosphate synthase enzyme YjbQ [Acidimicrobiia bacterium]